MSSDKQTPAAAQKSSTVEEYSSRHQFLRNSQELAAYDMLRSTLDTYVPLSYAHNPPILIPPLYDGDTRRVRARELLILMEVLLGDDDDPGSMLDILAGRFFTKPVQTKAEEGRVALYGEVFLKHCKSAAKDDVARLVYEDVFGGTPEGEGLFRRLFYIG